jgi:hypothetical protein
MRSSWTPSLVSDHDDQTVDLVVDDSGRLGRAYREIDVKKTDLETAISDLLSGQYRDPGQVCCVQHLRRLVAGCFGRHRAGASTAGRFGNARRTFMPARFCREA